jgi:hypothetical protein
MSRARVIRKRGGLAASAGRASTCLGAFAMRGEARASAENATTGAAGVNFWSEVKKALKAGTTRAAFVLNYGPLGDALLGAVGNLEAGIPADKLALRHDGRGEQ